MLIAFTLSMPSCGSWNGKWTAADRLYAKVISIRSKKRANEILAKGSFRYNFGDGWVASISVKTVDAKEARQLRNKSKGFCGYDWMVDSIRADLDIIAPSSRNT